MELENFSTKLGLTENQADVYLTLLQLGSSRIPELAKKTGKRRTTIYTIMDALIDKGLAGLIQKGGHREYFAENPKKIPGIIERQVIEIKERERSVSEIVPELVSLFNSKTTKPKIRTYEGIEGIKAVFEETPLLPKGSETLAYASYQTIQSYLDQWIRSYMNQRAKKGITQRCIAEDSVAAREDLVKNDVQDLRVTRLVPKDKFPFVCDQINIFGNKVFIASYADLLAVVIESEAIAQSMKTIFELSWLGAEKAKTN